MENRIVFLGTAGDSFVLRALQRTAAGIIIQHGETQIHINPGPGALYRTTQLGIDPRKTSALIVTDNSLLHTHETNALIDIMSAGCFDPAGLLLAAKSAVKKGDADEEGQPLILPKWRNAVERTIIMEKEKKVGYNNVQIQAVEIKNTDPHAVGIKILTQDYSLCYLPQTKYAASLNENCKGVEILILEVTNAQTTKRQDGLSIEEAQKLITNIKPQVALLTGFGNTVLKEDLLEITRDFNKKTGIQTIAAKDGFSFDPTSYAVKLRQKRLSF